MVTSPSILPRPAIVHVPRPFPSAAKHRCFCSPPFHSLHNRRHRCRGSSTRRCPRPHTRWRS
eukprot:13277614-Alexandrium_andersonii.AAC.1